MGEMISELGQSGSILDGSEFPSSRKMGTNSPTVSVPIESAVILVRMSSALGQ